MKIVGVFLLIVFLLISSCGGGTGGSLNLSTNSQNITSCRPAFWRNSAITGETVLVLQGKTTYPLWQDPVDIIEVKQALTGKVYSKNVDYKLQDGKLVILSGAIPMAPAQFPFTPDITSRFLNISITKDGRGLRINQDFKDWQIEVTYTASASPTPPPPSASLSRYAAMFANGLMPSITLYGDSITLGADADSGMSFFELLSKALAGKATLRNQAVGGWDATEALSNVKVKLNDKVQDVVVIAFGMNDATGNGDKALFKSQLQQMIDIVRAQSPQTEFMLLSGIRGNQDWIVMRPEMFDQYRAAMYELAASQAGISVLDMTSVWDTIVPKKSFYDVTVNGVNHPWNFGHKLYADVIIQALAPQPGCI
jgi:lysophospholipase L1-like esterase